MPAPSGISTDALSAIENGFVDTVWPVCATAV
jgi:hypothetical protein